MPVDITDIERLVQEQEVWRREKTVNLIASENAMSRGVRDVQNSDFMGRYAEGHPNEEGQINRYYQGTAKIDEVERTAREEMKQLFRCRQADVRPISGNAANTAIALGYLRGGDPIIVNSTDAGGHISHNTIGTFGRRIQARGRLLSLGKSKSIPLHFFPLTEDLYHTDVPKSIDLIEQISPRMVILGRSLFLFPEPVRELSEICHDKGIPILYDGAHVFGLIAGGQFQDPLRDGATYLTASTHKTFPGPQRGVILADLEGGTEKTYWPPADRGVFPGSSSNHHLHTLPALVVATREMQAHGRTYASKTVANAMALGRALDEQGIPVQAKGFGFTQSHQIAVDVSSFGGGVAVACGLEENDIIVNYNMLPGDRDARNPSGLRVGVQEMTRFGMGEDEMGRIAELMAASIRGKNIKAEVNGFRGRYLEMHYV